MSYVQLTPQERYVIYHLKLLNLSLREAAHRLHRHHSTISRELKHNGPSWPGAVYWHEAAQSRALERRQRPPIIIAVAATRRCFNTSCNGSKRRPKP